jgi:hypothetical protein
MWVIAMRASGTLNTGKTELNNGTAAKPITPNSSSGAAWVMAVSRVLRHTSANVGAAKYGSTCAAGLAEAIGLLSVEARTTNFCIAVQHGMWPLSIAARHLAKIVYSSFGNTVENKCLFLCPRPRALLVKFAYNGVYDLRATYFRSGADEA